MSNSTWFCPVDLSDLIGSETGYECISCRRRYPVDAKTGQPDFRLSDARHLRLDYAYDPQWGKFNWDLVRLEWPKGIIPSAFKSKLEPTEFQIAQSIPAATQGDKSLDLGCGSDRQRFGEILKFLGYEHIGIDIDGAAPNALADIHLLPFRDSTFDFLVSTAVFEHVKNPHIAMTEAARVAKPGAVFKGSIAFSEPFHVSYFHHSPLAVYELLESSGFEVQSIVLSTYWSAFRAHLQMGFAGVRYPSWFRNLIAIALYQATLIHPRVKRLIGRGSDPLQKARLSFARGHSALVGFVAVRRPRVIENRVKRECVLGFAPEPL